MISIMGIILVLFITFYGTKWLAVKASNLSDSKYMAIVDRIAFGPNKYLAIVRISDKYYLVSIAEQNVSIVKELDQFEIKESEKIDNNKTEEFKNVFINFLKKK